MGLRIVIAAMAVLVFAAAVSMFAWIASWSVGTGQITPTISSGSPAPESADLTGLNVTVCARSDCVLVRAGGFSFLFGAGQLAGPGLERTTTSLDSLDAVFLTGTGFDAIAGLATVRQITWMAGRKYPLRLVGPEGTDRIAYGINAMLEAHDARTSLDNPAIGFASAPLIAQTVRTTTRSVVFDSGLVQISAYDGNGPRDHLLYRVDYSGQTILIAGCGITPDVWVKAAWSKPDVAIAAIGTGSDQSDMCPSVDELTNTLANAGLQKAYVWSRSGPIPERISSTGKIRIIPATPGTRLPYDK